MNRMPATKKVLAVFTIAVALVGFSASRGFCWGSATHAYIDDRLGKSQLLPNNNEIYGGMSADIFVSDNQYPNYTDYLYRMTHEEYQLVWNTRIVRAPAYGFATHNGVWGADFTALSGCLTCTDTSNGYVIIKAQQMMEEDTFQALNLNDDVLLELCRNFVEWAVDIMLTTSDSDHTIAKKMEKAARYRPLDFRKNLVKAYASKFSEHMGIPRSQAVGFIRTAEAQFRDKTIRYGQALQTTTPEAVDEVALLMSGFIEAYLDSVGVTLPPGDVINLISAGIYSGMALCQADLNKELDATISFVNQRLIDNQIGYR